VTSSKSNASIWFPSVGILGIVCAAGLTAAWCVASLWFPFGWDQGFFASVGEVILRGGMPYRDGWELKGPLTYYAFALAEWLFGRHMWSIRILDLPLLIAGMVALARIVKRIASPLAGWWAAIVFALWIGSLSWFHMVQPDIWVANFILLGAAPLMAGRFSPRQFLFAGVMAGCAGLVKPLYVAFVAIPLVQIAWQHRSDKVLRKLVLIASVVGAALLPPLLAASWFAYRGALRDLIDVHLLYTLQVYSGSGARPIWYSLPRILRFFLKGVVPWGLPVIAAGAYSLWRSSRSSALMLLTWFTIALMCVGAQGKFYKYHWIPLFPPLLIAGAIGFRWLLMLASDEVVNRTPVLWRALCGVALSMAAIGILQLAIVPAAGVRRWLSLMDGRMSRDQYYGAYEAGHFNVSDNMRAAQYIRERTEATDGVAVFGNEALLNFLSGRANPTRFVYAMPLTEGSQRSPRAAYRREYIANLEKKRPAYFVIGLPWAGTKEQTLHGFPELEDLLSSGYSLETRIGILDLYRRKVIR
jgi:4-amino-4-deoxy-L-arabinose transferase-like glycosyltransferase